MYITLHLHRELKRLKNYDDDAFGNYHLATRRRGWSPLWPVVSWRSVVGAPSVVRCCTSVVTTIVTSAAAAAASAVVLCSAAVSEMMKWILYKSIFSWICPRETFCDFYFREWSWLRHFACFYLRVCEFIREIRENKCLAKISTFIQ